MLERHIPLIVTLKALSKCAFRPVVVLAERDKELMDRELRRELGRHPTVEWHTRCGAPHSIADLERVNAGLAKTIILMHPELGAGDGEVRVPFP